MPVISPRARTKNTALVDFCKENIARFKAPSAVEFTELPKTSTGKVQKFVLRDKEWAGQEKRVH
jgi:fatty-acyl-CoA synthase